MSFFTIGIDIGGTNIKLGLVNRSGKILVRAFLETKKYHRKKTELIEALVLEIQRLIHFQKLSNRDITGIGIGLPGIIDPKRGRVGFLPNIPGWRNVPLREIIRSKLHVPIFIDNDVNLVTLAEWQFGAGQGVENLICLTLGTGVGGGLVFDNRLYRGEGFAAGELGHMPLNERGPCCPCGGWGCFERYVGNGYLLRKAAQWFRRKNISLPEVYRLAHQGNQNAIRFWHEAGEHIGNALVSLVNLLNPRLIIIGGGVSNNYKFMEKTVNAVIKKRAMKFQARMVKIKRAKLGDDAGIIGAQVLVKEATRGF
jgi:glucokinase